MRKGLVKRYLSVLLAESIILSHLFVGSMPLLSEFEKYVEKERYRKVVLERMDKQEETDMGYPMYEILPAPEPKTLGYVYGYDNVVYKDFHNLDFEGLPDHEVKVPEDLDEKLYDREEWTIKDRENFETNLLFINSMFGNDTEIFYTLSPRYSVELLADVVVEGIDYSYVDRENDPHFYDRDTPLDQYLYGGWGDCERYAFLMVYGFDLMKEKNPRLKNVYISDKDLGGNTWRFHQWNSIVLMFDNHIEVSFIDPTWYDSDFTNFEGDSYHVNQDLFHFYLQYGLEDYDAAVDSASNAYHKLDRKSKANLLQVMAKMYYDRDKLGRDEDRVLEYYDSFLDESFHEIWDEDFRDASFIIMEYAFDIYIENEQYAEAHATYDEMVRLSQETSNYYHKRDWPKTCDKLKKKHHFLKW